MSAEGGEMLTSVALQIIYMFDTKTIYFLLSISVNSLILLDIKIWVMSKIHNLSNLY